MLMTYLRRLQMVWKYKMLVTIINWEGIANSISILYTYLPSFITVINIFCFQNINNLLKYVINIISIYSSIVNIIHRTEQLGTWILNLTWLLTWCFWPGKSFRSASGFILLVCSSLSTNTPYIVLLGTPDTTEVLTGPHLPLFKRQGYEGIYIGCVHWKVITWLNIQIASIYKIKLPFLALGRMSRTWPMVRLGGGVAVSTESSSSDGRRTSRASSLSMPLESPSTERKRRFHYFI